MRAVIFDLDGTLADTVGEIGAAMNQALAERGLPTHPLDAYRDFVGEGAMVLARRALPPGSDADLAALVASFLVYYEPIELLSPPYPGIPELLDALAGVPKAVVSNKPDGNTRRIIAHTFSRWRWEAVLGMRPELPKKPDPAMALEAARRLGVAPADCTFVGDTAIDVATARAAGMRAVGVSWGFRPRELAGADLVLAHPADLLR
jgi:phosphoglycolate phosphatase